MYEDRISIFLGCDFLQVDVRLLECETAAGTTAVRSHVPGGAETNVIRDVFSATLLTETGK